jgi:hypothetical protein
MKRLFLALLLALTLSASPARAGFVATALGAAVAAFGAGAGLIGAVSVGLQVLTSTFAGKLFAGIGLSLVGQLFQKKPRASAINPRGIQTESTTNGDVTPLKVVVGTYGVEGHLVAPLYSTGQDNKILTYIMEVSNIPVTGLTGRVVVDGEWRGISDVVGYDLTELARFIGDFDLGNVLDDFPVQNRAWIKFYDGTQTSADPGLVARYGDHPDRPWSEDHVLRGTAYAIMHFWFDQEVFSGLPAVRYEVQGIPLYDPRKDSTVGGDGAHRWTDSATWEFSDNPMVIAYNVMRGITLPNGDIYGGEVPAEDLPLDNWIAGMNECDVLIGDRTQFRAGFEIDTNEVAPFEVVEEMLRACFGQISEFGGVFRIRVGAPAEGVMHLTDDDFVITEPRNFDPFPGLAGVSNAFTGTYVEPTNLWAGTSLPGKFNAAWEAEDGNRRLSQSIDLPAVFDPSQGQHLLEAYAKDARRFRTHKLGLPPSYGLLEPLDAITWTSEEYGYTEKVFEVVRVEERPGTLIQIVTVRERDAGDVAWTPEQDLPAAPSYNHFTDPALPVLSIPAESIISATRVIREAVQNVISISVTYSDEDAVPRVEVQYQRDGDSDWTILATGGLGRFDLVAPEVGSYRFRARTFGLAQQRGPWTTTGLIATTTLQDAPDDVTGFFAEVNAGITTLEWQPVDSGDLSYYRIRHATETSGATWANSTTAVDKVPRPGTSVALPTRPGTYLIKAVSKTGVPSTDAATVVITDDDTPDFAQTLTDDEHPTFGGTKTGVEVESNALRITDPSTAPSEGTYDFSGYIETHDATVRRVRARVDVEVTRSDEGSGTWDDIPGTWDTWPGTWDTWTGSPQFADTDVEFFISTTADDPAGTPTWSDWRRFRVAEFRGRAFRFRAVLRSTSANVTPSISEMTAIVEYDT